MRDASGDCDARRATTRAAGGEPEREPLESARAHILDDETLDRLTALLESVPRVPEFMSEIDSEGNWTVGQVPATPPSTRASKRQVLSAIHNIPTLHIRAYVSDPSVAVLATGVGLLRPRSVEF